MEFLITWLMKFLREKRRKININSNQTLISWNWATLAKNLFYVKNVFLVPKKVQEKLIDQVRNLWRIHLGSFAFVAIFHIFSSSWGNVPKKVKEKALLFSSIRSSIFVVFTLVFRLCRHFFMGKSGLFLYYYLFWKVLWVIFVYFPSEPVWVFFKKNG